MLTLPRDVDPRRLLSDHAALVRRIANRYRCSGAVTVEDLEQEGAIALVEAAQRYETNRGVAFGTFAARRISGRIKDLLRSLDHLGRKDREKVRAGKLPDVALLSLHQVVAEESQRGLQLGDLVGTVDRSFEAVDHRDQVAEILAGVNHSDRQLLERYYLDGLPMLAVGIAMNVSEPRVSQRLDGLLKRLRERYSNRAAARRRMLSIRRRTPMGEKNRGTLKLDEARELTPAVSPVEAMRRQLALALFDSVKPQDVLDMATKLKEMAQAGDLKAMKMYFDLVIGKDKPAPPPPPAEGAGLKMMAEALHDLVDEIRVGKARAGRTAKEERKLIANGVASDSNQDEE